MKSHAIDHAVVLRFREAIKQGSEAELQKLIMAEPAILAHEDKNGMVGHGWLHQAITYGHEPVVRFFLDAGLDVNHKNDAGETALFWAAQRKHRALINLLLDRGADPRLPDHEGATPLHLLASGSGSADLIRRMVAMGANPSHQTKDHVSPLRMAVTFHEESNVLLLLSLGADLELRSDGESALAVEARLSGQKRLADMLNVWKQACGAQAAVAGLLDEMPNIQPLR